MLARRRCVYSPCTTVGEFRKPWKALLEAANIAHTDPYVLRHTFASEADIVQLASVRA